MGAIARTGTDVCIVGLGAFGSATAYHLAKAGMKVLGLDSGSNPGHAGGSSHGHTRIIRLAYREGLEYVPLLKRSYKLFQDLGLESGQQLLIKTGMLDIGPSVVSGQALSGAQLHGLRHEVLTGAQVNKRFPGYQLPDDLPALYQPDGGMLRPEACIQAHCSGAERMGARLQWGQGIRRWRAAGSSPQDGVEVEMQDGTVHTAGQLVLAPGPWMTHLVPAFKELLTVVRQVVGWFEVKQPGTFDPRSFPVFILDSPQDSQDAWYGFPQFGPQPGFKIGLYNHLNQVVDPDTISRQVTPEDEEALRAAVHVYFPAADGQLLASSVCMFTNTIDGHFLVDRHPLHPQVMLCSACSGHGFKMSSGVGQLMAEDVATWPGHAHAHGGSTTPHRAPHREHCSASTTELALHRIQPGRPGHTAFLQALQSQPHH